MTNNYDKLAGLEIQWNYVRTLNGQQHFFRDHPRAEKES